MRKKFRLSIIFLEKNSKIFICVRHQASNRFFSDCGQRAESGAVTASNESALESIQCENELVNHTYREKKKNTFFEIEKKNKKTNFLNTKKK